MGIVIGGEESNYSDKRNGNWDQSIREMVTVDQLHCPNPDDYLCSMDQSSDRDYLSQYHPLGCYCWPLRPRSTGASARLGKMTRT